MKTSTVENKYSSAGFPRVGFMEHLGSMGESEKPQKSFFKRGPNVLFGKIK